MNYHSLFYLIMLCLGILMQSGCKMPKIPTTPPDRYRVGVVLPFSYQFTCGLAPGGEPYRNVTVEITVLRPLNMNNPPTLTQFDFQTYVVNNDDNDPDNLEFYAYVPKEGPCLVEIEIIQDCSNCCQTDPSIYCNPPYSGNRGRPRWAGELAYITPPVEVNFNTPIV